MPQDDVKYIFLIPNINVFHFKDAEWDHMGFD